MTKNMGTTDRIIRIAVAMLIALLYFTNVISGVLAIVLLVIAFIFTVTSFLGYCPLYSLFGIRTCRPKGQ
jgi:hypothetical protein